MQFNAFPLQILALAIAVFGLTGCPDVAKKKDAPNPRQVENDWDVDGTKVFCTSADCPNALGVLLSVTRTETDHYYYKTIHTQVSRCTATLINSRQLITAGHCVSTLPKTNTYFRTVAAPGRSSRTFKVQGVALKAYNPNGQYDKDFAILNLATPAEGYDYFEAPTEESYANLARLTALVINQPVDWDNYKFSLDAVSCQVLRDDFYPDLNQFPAVFGLENCRLVSGNSGGPVVAPERSKQVLGVLSKSTEGDSEDPAEKNKPKPGLNRSTLSSAACISLPGWTKISSPCLELGADYINKRSIVSREKIVREFVQREMTEWARSENATVKIGKTVYQTAPLMVDLESPSWVQKEANSTAYVLIPNPICVVNGELTSGQASLKPMFRKMTASPGRFEARSLEVMHGEINLSIAVLEPEKIKVVMEPMIFDSNWMMSSRNESLLASGETKNIGRCRGDELDKAAERMINTFLKD